MSPQKKGWRGGKKAVVHGFANYNQVHRVHQVDVVVRDIDGTGGMRHGRQLTPERRGEFVHGVCGKHIGKAAKRGSGKDPATGHAKPDFVVKHVLKHLRGVADRVGVGSVGGEKEAECSVGQMIGERVGCHIGRDELCLPQD